MAAAAGAAATGPAAAGAAGGLPQDTSPATPPAVHAPTPAPMPASPVPVDASLFGLSGDTSSGNAWQGSRYNASTRTFTKWWPAIYPGEWKLPNGMRYPFIWRLVDVGRVNNQGREEWTWDWVETPGMPSIVEVEQMLLAHRQQQAQEAAARQAAADAGRLAERSRDLSLRVEDPSA